MRAPDRAAEVATSGSGGIFDGKRADVTTAAAALKYAPRTLAEIISTAKSLAASGYGDYSIAAVLALDVNAIRALIGERE
jgi:hypothetical protein